MLGLVLTAFVETVEETFSPGRLFALACCAA